MNYAKTVCDCAMLVCIRITSPVLSVVPVTQLVLCLMTMMILTWRHSACLGKHLLRCLLYFMRIKLTHFSLYTRAVKCIIFLSIISFTLSCLEFVLLPLLHNVTVSVNMFIKIHLVGTAKYIGWHIKNGPFHIIAYDLYITHILKISITYLQYLKH